MQFDLTDDRRMLHDSLTRLLADQGGMPHRNAHAYDPPYHSPALWQALSELGVFYAFAPEDQGGMGGDGFDVLTVFQALGAALCAEPVLGQLMAIRLKTGGDLEPLLRGDLRYAVAVEDLGLDPVRPDGAGLSGRLSVVYGGAAAARLVVAAQGRCFDVAAGDCTVNGYAMMDGGGAAEVFLQATPATLLPGADLADALDWGRLALCAEAVGAIDATLKMLLDYLKTRTQFGRPIGQFQVLQHRMVDLMVEAEQARSITILAASKMATPDQGRHVAMAKHLVGRVAQQVAEEAIQMHGGIAMTWEAPVSHYAKRLVMIDAQLGDQDVHLETVIAALQS